MSEKNGGKKKVWIYAVILFTSAFIVLLLTAVSQIKLNKNISDYKTQIYAKEKEKSDFQLNLSSSKNENKKLQEELKITKEVLDNEIKAKENEIKKQKELETKIKEVIDSYENLIKAENEFLNEDYVTCALILSKQCDAEYLNDEATKKYLFLREKTYGKASKTLYTDGLKKYRRGEYDAAVSNFQSSVDLMPNEYYSDDCYYYIAYSLYMSGKYDFSVKAVDKLLIDYPSSSYISDAYDLLKLMKK